MTTVVIVLLGLIAVYANYCWMRAEQRHLDTLRRYQTAVAREEEATQIIVQLTAALRLRNLASNLGRLPRRPQDRIHVN